MMTADGTERWLKSGSRGTTLRRERPVCLSDNTRQACSAPGHRHRKTLCTGCRSLVDTAGAVPVQSSATA